MSDVRALSQQALGKEIFSMPMNLKHAASASSASQVIEIFGQSDAGSLDPAKGQGL